MSKCLSRFLAAALCALVSLPAFAQEAAEPPGEALLADAATYAGLFGVDLDEAVRRLQLQDEAGRLSAVLREEEAGSFAGLWIEHQPSWIVIARFRNPAAARPGLEERVAGTRLAGLVELRSAARSLAQLEDLLAATRRSTRALDVPVDLSIDVRNNRVEARTEDAPRLRAALAAARVDLPRDVAVVEVDELPRPEATMVGGQPASTCTWAFTVRRSNGDVGISTAAHCGNTQAYSGTNLPFRAQDQQGNQDVQWHSACDLFDVSNQFQTGIGLRSCTATRSRDQQAIGSLVCKNGMTTGYTCGIIQSKSYAPHWVTSAQATFIYVDGDQVGTNLSEGGDSGGPWFVEQYAYGVHSGGGGNDAIYMPINYISSLGVSVLTFDPPANCVICGDGVCETGESCSADCSTTICGDGICDPGESCFSDCGSGCEPCIICPCDGGPGGPQPV